MQTVMIIQARMGSSRLPGKVMKDLAGKPMMEWVVTRGSRAKLIDRVMLATTTDPGDDPIAEWCESHQIPCFRGNVYDVLDRYYQAAKTIKADLIVRVTADCPLIDPDVLDDTIRYYLENHADFGANRLPPPWHRTFPIGLDTEVVSFEMLEKAWNEATELFEREHVMPWFYDTEGRCKIALLNHDPDYGMHRWTVDTPEDYEMMKKIFENLLDPEFASWLDVLKLIETHPDFETINANSHAKQVDVVDQRAEKHS